MIFSEKSSAEAFDRLRSFLESTDRPEDTFTYNELLGFLFTIACSPEMIPPSDWIPMIFADEEANYRDSDEANTITETIMILYGQCNQQIVDGNPVLPPSCAPSSSPMANFYDAPLGQWANGFFIGSSYLEDVWNTLIQDEWEEEWESCLMVLSFFTDIKLAEAYSEGALTEERSIEQLAEGVLKVFDDAMVSYARMGRALYLAMLELEQEDNESAAAEHVVQNKPCPCGSGEIFSKCCGMPKTIH